MDAQAKKHFKLVLALDEKNEEAAKALGLEVKPEKPAAEPKAEPAKTAAPPESAKPPGERKGGLFNLEGAGAVVPPKKDTGTALDESLQGLRLYASEKDVIAALGEPEQRKPYDNGQSGMYYPERGLHVVLNARGVYAFNILSPDWRLKSGIQVGGSLEDVLKLYGPCEDKVTGSLGQYFEKPVLITDPKNGNQAIRYHTGYSFWARPSGEILMIRVTLEGMKGPRPDAGQKPQTPTDGRGAER